MSEEKNHNLMEDAEDECLKSVMGNKFQDKTKDASHVTGAMRANREMEQKYPSHLKTAADSKNAERSKALDGEWKPVPTYAPNWFDKLKDCVKWTLTFGALSCLFFYWQQTGLMAPQAAVPSMCACTLLVGWGVGKNAVK